MLPASIQQHTAPYFARNNPLTLLLRLLFIFWLLAKKIGWRIWLKDRLLPVAPVADLPSWMHYTLLYCSVALLIALLYKPWHRGLLCSLLICEVVSCLADQNRWQPWEYQYLFTLLTCLIFYRKKENIIPALACIAICIYLYSGLGKLNEGYLQLFWSNMFLKNYLHLSQAAISHKLLYYSGYATALIEVTAALMLLYKRTQRSGAMLLILMHFFILVVLGPFGLRYNKIIWPWNVLMMVQLYILFIQSGPVPFNLERLFTGWGKIVLLCWGILPALNYAGLWDSYLSSKLYAGNLPQMVLCIETGEELNQLKRFTNKTYKYNICNGLAMVNLQTWAMKETNVPPYPEIRVYRQMSRRWKQQHPGTTTRIFIYYPARGNTIRVLPEL
ncbi:MAG TPA: hypothetical protein PKC39_13770 [Ferruginibacter sp.]|nr:hypothetical protein [Ferruginibacter sp.]HMP22024.1 hypothetical protein [Ferruginibacter sp.]